MQELLTPEQLRKLAGHTCPRCGHWCRLYYNFCGMCTYMVNPAGYFHFLANHKK